METPKKPHKKKSAVTQTGTFKKIADKPIVKPKSRFIDDDDDDDQFDGPIDELGAFDNLDGLEEEEDY